MSVVAHSSGPKIAPHSRAPLCNPAHKHNVKAVGSHSCLCLKGQVPDLRALSLQKQVQTAAYGPSMIPVEGRPTNLQRRLQIHPKLKAFEKITGLR